MISVSEPDRWRQLSRPKRALGVLVSALIALLRVSPVHAQDAETRTAARDLATQGAQAFDAGQYEQASDLFLRAYELVHAPSIALMRARSLAKLGRLLEAVDSYEQTAHTKLAADAPGAFVKAVDAARTEVEDVRRRVPRLRLTLTGVNAGDSPQVRIDDVTTPAALLGVERPMDPGSHHVVVFVAHRTRTTRELSLEEGKNYSIELDASHDATPAGLAPGTPAPATSPGASSSLATSRVFAYAGLGVGVLGLGIGTYSGLVALHHKSQLDAVCHPGCPESSGSDLSSFRSNRTVSWLSYGVGVAAMTTGVLLLTLGEPEREHVSFGMLPGFVQIRGRL